MPRLIWSPQALSDLSKLHRFLLDHDEALARRAIKTIREGLTRLEANRKPGERPKECRRGFGNGPFPSVAEDMSLFTDRIRGALSSLPFVTPAKPASSERIELRETAGTWHQTQLLRILLVFKDKTEKRLDQNSRPPFGTVCPGASRTTSPASSGSPSVSTSERIGPIWRGGKLTTAIT